MRRLSSIIAAAIYLSLLTCCRAEACAFCVNEMIVWYMPFIFWWLLVCAVWLVAGLVFRAMGRLSGQRVKIQYARSWPLVFCAVLFTLLVPALLFAVLITYILIWMYRTHVSIKALKSRAPADNAFLHFQRLMVLALAVTAVYSTVQARNDVDRAISALYTPSTRGPALQQLARIGLDALPKLEDLVLDPSHRLYLPDQVTECALQIIRDSPADEERWLKRRFLTGILERPIEFRKWHSSDCAAAADVMLEIDKAEVAAMLPARIEELVGTYQPSQYDPYYPTELYDPSYPTKSLARLVECVVKTGDREALGRVLTDATMNVLIAESRRSDAAREVMVLLGSPNSRDPADYRKWWYEAKKSYLSASQDAQSVRTRTTSQAF